MRLQARVKLTYAGQVWQPGALFDALPEHGRDFINRDQAIPYNLEDPSTRSLRDILEEMQPPPPPAPVTVVPASLQMAADGGPGNFGVAMTGEGSWTATTAETWLHIDSPSGPQTANGTVSFTAQAHNGTVGEPADYRTGTVQVNDAVFTVTQAPWDVLPVELMPKEAAFGSTGGSGTFAVTITGSGTSGTWTVDIEDDAKAWLSVDSPVTAQSVNGQVAFTVWESALSTERTGKLFVNGQPFTVTQSGA